MQPNSKLDMLSRLEELANMVLNENYIPSNIKGVMKTVSDALQADIISTTDLRLTACYWLLTTMMYGTEIGTVNLHREWNHMKSLADNPDFKWDLSHLNELPE
jgi:hypothetical protein